jgi:FMN-dependent NADH-azoreductase
MEQFQDHDVLTDEVIVRDMTEQELSELKAVRAAQAAKDKAAKDKAEARADLLERLGITEDEAKLLLA